MTVQKRGKFIYPVAMNIKKKGDSTMTNKDVTTDVIEAIKMALEDIKEEDCRLSQKNYDEIAADPRIDVKVFKEHKYLERPFAYEFYHKLRVLMECGKVDFGEPIVQAEVSKAYQNIFADRKTPDFIIHIPNNYPLKDNLAVIEFKLSTNLTEIEHDFDKLVDFKTHPSLEYAFGIEVIIGNTESLKKATPLIDKLDNHKGEEIIIIDFDTILKKANDRIIHYTYPKNPKRI